MTYSGEDYDVIVIGKGTAGKEVAKKAARMGKTALLLKLNPGSIASVMCSSSQQGSPQGIPDGIEAQLIGLEEESDWAPKLRFKNIDSDSHHSVYILQAPELTQESSLLSEESFSNEAESSQRADDESSIQDPQFTFEPESSPEQDHGLHTEEEGRPFDDSLSVDEKSLRWKENPSLNPAPEPEEDSVLHERELHNRKRLLHRQAPTVNFDWSPSSPTTNQPRKPEKPKEPIFREREKELRKKLVRDRRPTVDRGLPVSKNVPTPPHPSQQERKKEEPPAMGRNTDFPERKESPSDSLAKTGETGQSPQRTSSSVIPMDQGRMKYRKANRYKEPFRLFSKDTNRETPPPEPEQNPEISRSKVWEAHEQPTPPSSTNTGESQREPTHQLTYEPFQRTKERGPFSGQSFEPFGEKPRMGRKEDQTSASPPTSGPLQGQSRKPPSTPKPEEELTTQQQKRKRPSPPPLRREEPKKESSFHLNQEAARNVLKNSNDGLKKDDIDISDPFGQSYDELFTPFSGGNSQEENLEKRKLALRGLHNLINNLG